MVRSHSCHQTVSFRLVKRAQSSSSNCVCRCPFFICRWTADSEGVDLSLCWFSCTNSTAWCTIYMRSKERRTDGSVMFVVSGIEQLIVCVVVCSNGRCQQIVKLFVNYQRISDVLKDKPSSTAGAAAGGSKKRRRPTKDVPASSAVSSAAGKTPGGMFSIHFLSAALSALYRQALLSCSLLLLMNISEIDYTFVFTARRCTSAVYVVVCVSVCLSHAGIVLKQLNLVSHKQWYMIAWGL